MEVKSLGAAVQDWITPPHLDWVKVDTPVEQLERMQQRVKELREAMGSRYLCHEKNRVRRLDGRSYTARNVVHSNVSLIKQAANDGVESRRPQPSRYATASM